MTRQHSNKTRCCLCYGFAEIVSFAEQSGFEAASIWGIFSDVTSALSIHASPMKNLEINAYSFNKKDNLFPQYHS